MSKSRLTYITTWDAKETSFSVLSGKGLIRMMTHKRIAMLIQYHGSLCLIRMSNRFCMVAKGTSLSPYRLSILGFCKKCAMAHF